MAAPTGRDPEQTQRALAAWLATRLDVQSVVVSDLKIPRAGFSNETILGVARWTDGCTENERPFVLRIEPSTHQLFQESDALRQAAVMRGLAGHVPVPRIWLTDDDPSVFGAPFFLMDRIDGRIPSDLPSWHERGWTTELSPRERGVLYDNGLAAMAELHCVDWRADLTFLEPDDPGSALDQYVAHVSRWYDWSEPSRKFGTDTIDAAMKYIVANQPHDTSAQISWGDARPGNIVYADDLAVAAMLDWEGATVAPPAVDVGWWLMFEEFLCEAQGLERLEGVPGRDGTIARYEELSGRSLDGIEYYEIVAGLVFALINSRLADLLIAGGKVDPSFAASIVTRVTDMLARWMSG